MILHFFPVADGVGINPQQSAGTISRYQHAFCVSFSCCDVTFQKVTNAMLFRHKYVV